MLRINRTGSTIYFGETEDLAAACFAAQGGNKETNRIYARRIVSCVKACVDMSTEYLEQCGKMHRNEAGEAIVELIQQRDTAMDERIAAGKRIEELEQQRDELLRIADGVNARRKLRGFLVPEDAQDFLEAIAKVTQS